MEQEFHIAGRKTDLLEKDSIKAALCLDSVYNLSGHKWGGLSVGLVHR